MMKNTNIKSRSAKWITTVLVLVCSIPMFGQHQPYTWSDEVSTLKRVDRLPEYRDYQVIEQVSGYDRTGGNDDGFSGKYSYLRKEKGNLVLAEFNGPGVVNRIWTPTPTNDTLLFFFDGEESPRLRIRFMDLFSGEIYPFVNPVCGNEVGGYYCYIPIPFSKSLKIIYQGEKIMFHQIQYRKLPGLTVESWSGNFSDSDKKMLTDVINVWEEVSPTIKPFTQGNSADFQTEEKTFIIQPGESVNFYDQKTAGRIVGFDIDGGLSFEGMYKDLLLSAVWDNEKTEAIYAPIADFFGYAYGKPAMRSSIMGRQGTTNYCYFPMPYDLSANLKLIYKKRGVVQQNPVSVHVRVYYNNVGRKSNEGKFYSVWKRERPDTGEFYEFLRLRGKGHYVGTILLAQGLRPGMTLFFEGDDSTFIDGNMRMHGTGSEDYFNGGWYALLDRWDRGKSMPLHGALDYSLPMNRTGGYRFFISDKMSFEKEIYHGIEHGPEKNQFPVDYTSLAFYYGAQPLMDNMLPAEDLRVVYLPQEHVYFPHLMDLTPDGSVQVTLKRGLRLNTDGEGMVRMMLNDVPEGKYKVLISYFEKPEGADFQIWQRQKPLSAWRSAKSSTEALKERNYIGDIELTKQSNSMTILVRKNDGGTQFELENIILERIN